MAEYLNVFKWLRDGANIEANVDGSSVPKVYQYTVGPGDTLLMYRMIVSYSDSGTFDASFYGNGATLNNGLLVKVVYADSSELDLLDGAPILSNHDWESMCYDFRYHDYGVGDGVATVRWTFANSGNPILLEAGDSFQVVVQDNLTVLTGQRFNIQGCFF